MELLEKADWKLGTKYSNGYTIYSFKKNRDEAPNRYLIEGLLTVGINGSFVIFKRVCVNYVNHRFGFQMSKHFNGHNAARSARAWFNYMLNNTPNYVKEIEGS